jgi:RNA polymerase sigma-70 factor (ECF subfamily)
LTVSKTEVLSTKYKKEVVVQGQPLFLSAEFINFAILNGLLMKNNSTSIKDQKLITALNHDDIFAFNELFHKYSQKIYNFTIKHVHHEEDVKDIVQDVFITIWNKRKVIDAKQSFNGYLFTITINAIRKHFRNKTTNKKVLEKWLKDKKVFSDVTKQTVEFRSLNERANKIIDELPPKRKMVFLLSREQGLKSNEIAREMNISTKTVENHLYLALRHLREKLKEETLLIILFFNFFY